MELLAVYGTLKSGYHNNWFLHNSELVGSGYTRDKYDIDTLTSIPMVRTDPQRGRISIELWKVPKEDLKGPIDSLESNGYCYQREKISVIVNEEEYKSVWLYFGLYDFYDHNPKPNVTDHKGEPAFNWG